MKRWFWNTVSALILIALTTFVTAGLNGPINDFVSRDKLKAQVILAPWIEKPDFEKLKDDKESDITSGMTENEKILRSLLEDIQGISTSNYLSENFNVARVNIENDSQSTVENINFRLESPYSEPEIVIINAEGDLTPIGRADRIKVPDMKPGDRVVVFMWGNFNSYTFPDSFKSYSSKGHFRVSFDWATTQEFRFESGISYYIEEYSGYLIGATLILAFLGMVIAAAAQEAYYKALLKEPSAYEFERGRYLKDPNKFTADFTSVETIVKKAESELASVHVDEREDS